MNTRLYFTQYCALACPLRAEFVVVHNGIITNYQDIKKFLVRIGTSQDRTVRGVWGGGGGGTVGMNRGDWEGGV